MRAASLARAEVRHFLIIALAADGVLLQEVAECLRDHLLGSGLHFGVHQFDFRLAFELRVADLDRDNRRQAFPGIVTAEVGVVIFEQAVLAGKIVDRAGDCRAQAGQVGAAVDRVDRVGKRIHRFGIGICVLDGSIDHQAVFHFFLHMHHRVQRFAVAVQVAYEGGDPAFKMEGHFTPVALVHHFDRHPAGDKGHLPEALHQGLKAVGEIALEDLLVKAEGGLGAGLARFDLAVALDGRLVGGRARSAGCGACPHA